MKNFIFVFLLCTIAVSYCDEIKYDNYKNEYDGNYKREYDGNYRREYDGNYRREYDGNYRREYYDGKYDDENREPIKQLCPKREIHCIRQVLSEKLQCVPLHGRRFDRYIFDNFPVYLAHANSTFVYRHAIVEGFDKFKINEFYLNEKTATLVFEVTLESVSLNSPRSTLYVYRKGKDPVVTEDYFNARYKDVSLTLTIEYDYKIYKKHVFSYLNDPKPIMNYGPGFKSDDPDAEVSFAKIMDDPSLTLKEAFVNQGQAFFAFFLNTVICDLNFKPVDKYKTEALKLY